MLRDALWEHFERVALLLAMVAEAMKDWLRRMLSTAYRIAFTFLLLLVERDLVPGTAKN